MMKKLILALLTLSFLSAGYLGGGIAYGDDGATGGIDVIFKIDESASFGPEIAAVIANAGTIADNLPPGSHVGVVGFGGKTSRGPHSIRGHVHSILLPAGFADFSGLPVSPDGALEWGYNAIVHSAEDTLKDPTQTVIVPMGFRGVPYCNILFTDEADPLPRY